MKSWEDYLIPGTQVLRNKLGITGHAELRAAEYEITGAREVELLTNPTPGFDRQHLRELHHHLFQDIYDWAGEYREVGMAKDNVDFARVDQIEEFVVQAEEIYATTPWPQLDADGAADQLGKMYGWLNVGHPFREGNGRTMAVVMNQALARTPYAIDFRQIKPALDRAARETMTDRTYAPDVAPVQQLFRIAIHHRPGEQGGTTERLRTAAADLDLALMAAERTRAEQGRGRGWFEPHPAALAEPWKGFDR